jgi:hypothetical protein
VRAVEAQPDRVVIRAGFTQALSLLTEALGGPVIALEDPGLIGREQIIAAAGGSHVGVPMDGHGLRTDSLSASVATVAVTTPAHQFPLSVILTAPRRLRVAFRPRSAVSDADGPTGFRRHTRRARKDTASPPLPFSVEDLAFANGNGPGAARSPRVQTFRLPAHKARFTLEVLRAD